MLSRRELLKLAGPAAFAATFAADSFRARAATSPDYVIDIAPFTLELSPRHRLQTVAYNGQVPGPLLRLTEGEPVTIQVNNRTDRVEIVHWHGLFNSPEVDGAAEECTPEIAPNSSARYRFEPRPAGFRWYHTHTMAMNDLTLAQYSGQHGFLLIEPRENPASYDQEIFLALHDWDGHLLASDDGAMNPSYNVATINAKTLGSGEPLRVKQGQRVLLQVLNSSPTEVHWLALAGHTLRVVAMDGNPVPSPRAVPMLRLAPAERLSAIVEMNNPGVWVLGEVRKHVQALGMAVVVEYAGQTGQPQWDQPSTLTWNYEQFAASAGPVDRSARARLMPLLIESRFRGHGSMEAWTINGNAYPQGGVSPLERGERYRLQFINKSVDAHPLHLHRHSFELCRLGVPLDSAQDGGGAEIHGLVKDVVLVDARTIAEVEFTADHPGKTLLHCHQQNHMDLGFMMLFDYV